MSETQGQPPLWTYDEAAIAEVVAAPLRAPVRPSDELEARVMSAVRTESRVRRRLRDRRISGGAVSLQEGGERAARRGITITPLGLVALLGVVAIAAAAAAFTVARSTRWRAEPATPSASLVPMGAPLAAMPVLDTVHVVRFTFDDSLAHTVFLVGDFNAWSREATPMERDSTRGRWTVAVPLSPGRHHYGFVVDGVRLVPDSGQGRTVVVER
ncbi:MAG TPA: hypothetical protein VEA99_17255 [Gemmatimonadaceae bacterium]|nr:hypothetical protein [Gemmatimonadaceae bacterium]